jgi:hypothetical protein
MCISDKLEDMLGEWVRIYMEDGRLLVRGKLLREGQRFCPNEKRKDKLAAMGYAERWEVTGTNGTALFRDKIVKHVCDKGLDIVINVQRKKGVFTLNGH